MVEAEPARFDAEPEIFEAEAVMVEADSAIVESEPAIVVAEPAIVVAEPAIVVADPAIVVADPAIVESDPAIVKADPAIVEADRAIVEGDPVIVEGDPVIVEVETAMVEAETAMVEAEGAMVEAEAEIVEAEPAIVEAETAIVEAETAIVEADPAIVEADKAIVEADPAIVEANPAIVEAEPAIVEAEPAIVEADPAMFEAEPAIVEADVAVDVTPSILTEPIPRLTEDVVESLLVNPARDENDVMEPVSASRDETTDIGDAFVGEGLDKIAPLIEFGDEVFAGLDDAVVATVADVATVPAAFADIEKGALEEVDEEIEVLEGFENPAGSDSAEVKPGVLAAEALPEDTLEVKLDTLEGFESISSGSDTAPLTVLSDVQGETEEVALVDVEQILADNERKARESVEAARKQAGELTRQALEAAKRESTRLAEEAVRSAEASVTGAMDATANKVDEKLSDAERTVTAGLQNFSGLFLAPGKNPDSNEAVDNKDFQDDEDFEVHLSAEEKSVEMTPDGMDDGHDHEGHDHEGIVAIVESELLISSASSTTPHLLSVLAVLLSAFLL
eukprot:GHVS01088070.1.p1 GENE.GHVS01088070.1~~GHVS01088070.1.p1  ORF type:complete len:595 (+),score=95.41 GHVS01088070.1:95-1786(+)